MINGDVTEFLDELTYQDHYVLYQGHKYFFNGCQCQYDTSGKITSVALEIYDLTEDTTVFSATQTDIPKCIKAFESSRIFNGKTFWEIEKDMEWVDN